MSLETWGLSVTVSHSSGIKQTTSVHSLILNEDPVVFTRLHSLHREEIVRLLAQYLIATARQLTEASTCPPSPSPSSGTSSECSSMSTRDFSIRLAGVERLLERLRVSEPEMYSASNTMMNLLGEHERRLAAVEQKLRSPRSDHET
jgi:hypothetical protein